MATGIIGSIEANWLRGVQTCAREAIYAEFLKDDPAEEIVRDKSWCAQRAIVAPAAGPTTTCLQITQCRRQRPSEEEADLPSAPVFSIVSPVQVAGREIGHFILASEKEDGPASRCLQEHYP